MVTGDHLLIAKETARELGMGDRIYGPEEWKEAQSKSEKAAQQLVYGADGFAQVMHEDKYYIVEKLQNKGHVTGMTGDGVNDAAALKLADVGIAVAGATDAARAAADIVLTQEGLSTIISGIIIARKIFVRIRNFIIYRVAPTLQLLSFFFISVFAFKPADYMPDDWQNTPGFDPHAWPEYFHMPVLMLMLITLLNDGTLIAIGYDNVIPTKDPCVWNL